MMTFRCALLAAVLFAGLPYAIAGHVEPAKAKKATFELVNAFLPCDTPNTATMSVGAPACAPAVSSNGGCAFGPGGSGKLTIGLTGSATLGTQDIKLAASAKGLSAGCENARLEIIISMRITTDDCPEGSCTIGDLYEFQFPGFCIVENGACKIKDTFSAAGNLGLINGKNTGIELLGCGLREFPGIPSPVATCGVLLK